TVRGRRALAAAPPRRAPDLSPLLALMRDQIAAAARAGIRAVTINSANVTEWDEVHAAIAAGTVDVVLCSPERLNNPGFRRDVLRSEEHTSELQSRENLVCRL